MEGVYENGAGSECREALDAFRLEAIQLEALTNAASEAVTQLPCPLDPEVRRRFDRVYALVTKVADETTALVAYGDELIDGFAKQKEEEEDGTTRGCADSQDA